MLFEKPDDFLKAPRHAVTVFGMSGVGKTRLSAVLQKGGWFHYSVDYRIGTRYMGEFIVDNFKREAMKVPLLRDLLRSDSIYISSNLTFDNLAPLSTYLGKPGNPKRGGIGFAEYCRRQALHREAEISALHDVPMFIGKAREIYGYSHFICDSGGSLCELVDPANPADPLLRTLADHTVLLYIRGTEDHARTLVDRFRRQPKPMYYQQSFLMEQWVQYKKLKGIAEDDAVDPDGFAVWGFEQLLHHRLPIYEAISRNFGYAVDMEQIPQIGGEGDFIDLMSGIIDRKGI